MEKLRDRLTEANSDVENWRAGNVEQEDLTECQYQVSRRQLEKNDEELIIAAKIENEDVDDDIK